MTCKDCVHYDICEKLRPVEWCLNKTCSHFKNKANFVELPCKVGDDVYIPYHYNGTRGFAYFEVTHIITDCKKSYVKTDFETDDEGFWDLCNGGEFYFDDFGKTIFLTMEEAKKVLKGGVDSDNK